MMLLVNLQLVFWIINSILALKIILKRPYKMNNMQFFFIVLHIYKYF